jgi:hypothetical protein
MVCESIEGNNEIDGCDFDEADPSNFIIKLFNCDECTFEIRFIKINNNECTCKISIVNLSQDGQFNFQLDKFQLLRIKILITPLNNYLVLKYYETVVFININENKVLIQTKITYTENLLCSMLYVPGTNDVIFSSYNVVHFFHFNEIQNELEVTKIIEYNDCCNNNFDYEYDIINMKIQNDLIIIYMANQMIYLYKLDDFKINNTSNPIVINKRNKEYCISSDKKIFSLKTRQNELFVYKFDDEMNQIAFLKLNEKTNCLVSSEKYISMVDESNENILTFEIKNQNM